MPKQAHPGPQPLEAPETPERALTPRPNPRQLQHQQPTNATESSPHTSPTILEITVLSKIRRFVSFAGCLYNSELNNQPTILLKVEYFNGETGWVHGLQLIPGQPESLEEALVSYGKIQEAKTIIGEENWSHMEKTLGFSKDITLQFEWFDEMKNASAILSPDLTTLTEYRLFGFTVGVAIGLAAGMAISISLVYGVVFGTGLSIGLSLGVGFGFPLGRGFYALGTSVAVSWLLWFLCFRHLLEKGACAVSGVDVLYPLGRW